MTSARAKSIALGCVVATGVIASVEHISDGRTPPIRVGVGVFVAGALLLALADSQPQLAAGFGLLLLTGSILRDGIPTARQLGAALS